MHNLAALLALQYELMGSDGNSICKLELETYLKNGTVSFVDLSQNSTIFKSSCDQFMCTL